MDFLEKFGKHMQDMGENIGLNTEVNKLNAAIEAEEAQIEKLYYFIGKAYYEAHKNDVNGEEWDRISQINGSLARIEEYKEAIHKLKDVIVCDNCQAEIPAGSHFCTKCGAKVEKEEEEKCPSCEKPVKKGAQFCGHCGTKLVEE